MEAGTPLGPYRIIRKLGAGGMGEVYVASDPRLGREVAIKVLPREMTLDAEALRRFQQEAMTVAALNHPNIVQVFDVGTAEDGSPFLVMELMEGESLRDRMGSKPMSVRKVAELCTQVARALGAAHSKGIIHRDLKPENVFLTKQGPAKVLDFGLAKLAKRETGLPSAGDDATRALFTQPGMVLGTVGYMPPEQVEGKGADARSDIFSLGVMMWEMVSGQRPFHRPSSIDTLHAILREDPPEIDPALGLPSAMERILRRCLEKDPDDRFQSAQDLAFQLDNLAVASSTATTVRLAAIEGEGETRKPWFRTPHRLFYPLPVKLPAKLKVCFWDRLQLSAIYLLILAALGLAGAGVLTFGGPEGHEFAKRFELAVDVSGSIQSAAVSRNGLHAVLAIAEDGGGTSLLYRRKGDTTVTIEKPPATEVLAVADSSTTLLRDPSGDLYLLEMGENANAMKIATKVLEADLTPDGTKLALLRHAGDKYVIEYPQGTPCYTAAHRVRDIKVSPKGDALAFFERNPETGLFKLKIWRAGGSVDVWRGGPRLCPKGEFQASAMRGMAWDSAGEALYAVFPGNVLGLLRGRSERILHRDAGSLRLHGATDEGPVLEVGTELVVDRGHLAGLDKDQDLSWAGGSVNALSDDGTQLLVARENEVWILPANRSRGRKVGTGSADALSPDGKTVLFTSNDRVLAVPSGGGDSRLITTRGELKALGFTFTGETSDPKLVFSQDGRWVLVCQKQLLVRKPADGSGSLERLEVPAKGLEGEWQIDGASSPNGIQIALQVRDESEQRWCLVLDAASKQQLQLVQLEDGERLQALKSGTEVLLFNTTGGTAELRSLDLKTAKRQALHAIAPPLPKASARFRNVRASLNGTFYTYRYSTMGVTQLMQAKGL